MLSLQLVDDRPQLDDLKRALRPVMLPADNHVAASRIMAMLAKVAAVKLELDPHPLPTILPGIDAALVLAIRVPCLYRLDDQAQLGADHPEEIHHALLVDRGMPEPTEIDRCPEYDPRSPGPLLRSSDDLCGRSRRHDFMFRLDL